MTKNLVTLGFRCKPELKTYLAKSALAQNITLSQHVNTLVSETDLKINELTNKIYVLNNERLKLKSIVERYESESLKKLFEKHKGETATISENGNQKKSITVNTIFDLYEVIIKSFK